MATRFRLPPRKTRKLYFDNGDLEGLEIKIKLDFPVRIMYMNDVEKPYEILTHCLVSWNMDDEDGNTLPCDEPAIAALPMSVAAQICTRVVEEVIGNTAPLAQVR